MTEAFLQYLFEYQLLENKEFEVLSSGQKNTDAGPDFFNAKIKLNDIVWAGNVEIHINASDWNKHQHFKDKSYDNIILHLVLNKDIEVKNSVGEVVKTLEIKFKKELYQKYSDLMQTTQWVHCQEDISKVDTFIVHQQIESLAIERLRRKSERFEGLIRYNENDYESAFFQALAIGFGGKVNAIPFELMAKETNLKTLLKNRHHLMSIEALLLGQAGILSDLESEDEYVRKMQQEYAFLKHKYQLKPIRKELLKYSKIRPSGFPDLKLAYLAQLIYKHSALLAQFYECRTLDEVKTLLEIEASSFWDTHYKIDTPSKPRKKRMGEGAKHHLIINIIIPFLYIYSEKNGTSTEHYLEWLQELKAEKNSIVEQWSGLGVKADNALESQGLIELKKEFCKKHLCLDCKIGHKILTLSWNE